MAIGLVVRRLAERRKVSTLRLMRSKKISGSSSSTNSTTVDMTKEENPVIYVRVNNMECVSMYPEYDWFCLRNDDVMSQKPPICKCGAVEDLPPAFVRPKYRPESSIAAVGHFIYVFGGVDIDNNCTHCSEVSYIDTHRPSEGWKVCENQMPKARALSYPINLDKERVLLVGGFDIPVGDITFSQIYNSSTDSWVAPEGYPDVPPPTLVRGNGVVVKEEGEGKKTTMVLMHGFGKPYLYTYNVNTDSWGIRWGPEFGTSYNSGALVGGIYYVLDVVTCKRAVLFGYDISKDHAKCLPVTILVKKGKAKERFPLRYSRPELVSLGDSKLAILWYDLCQHNSKIRRLTFYWSMYEMKKEYTDDVGGLKLVAQPLSHVAYHINDTDYFNGLVTVGFKAFIPLQDDIGPTLSIQTQTKSKSRHQLEKEKAKKHVRSSKLVFRILNLKLSQAMMFGPSLNVGAIVVILCGSC